MYKVIPVLVCVVYIYMLTGCRIPNPQFGPFFLLTCVYVDGGEKYLGFSEVNWGETFWVNIVTAILKKFLAYFFVRKKAPEITPGTYRLMKNVFAPNNWSLVQEIEDLTLPPRKIRKPKTGPYPWD